MAEPKPLASLSAGLLARKGAARPAMRRQAQALDLNGFGHQEDLGWNDMGYDVDPHHAGPDHARTVDHGLSPMAPPPVGTVATPDAFEALGEAVDRAMAQMPSHRAATVQPLDSGADVPESAEPPVVLEQQQRLEKALGAGEAAAPSAAPVPADALDAIRSAMTAATTAPVAVARQPAEAAPAAPSRSPRSRSRAGSRGNFAFTLRLDPHRHLRLRLASATSNRSAQQIIIQLIDDYLADLPEIDAFAAQVPASRTNS